MSKVVCFMPCKHAKPINEDKGECSLEKIRIFEQMGEGYCDDYEEVGQI